MRTSILICATCLLVTGASAQFRLPSLSSAFSSLTGFGSGGASGGAGAQQSGGQQSAASSAYSGLVRDYGRNLMMAMSSIYPTLFKPPQQQQAQAQQPSGQPAGQSPFEQFGASQQMPYAQSQQSSGPSFTFGGSTFSISPSFPFGALTGGAPQQPQQQQASAPGQQAQGAHSPFSASFGSSINSPPSFGPLSSSPFLAQGLGAGSAFAPASSYGAAFEAANGGQPGAMGSPSGASSMGAPMFASMGAPTGQMNSYAPLSAYTGGQHDSSAQLLSQPSHHQAQAIAQPAAGQQQQHHQQANQPQAQGPQFGSASSGGQYAGAQQFRPDMMSIAASAPVPSSSSYSNYANMPGQSGQGPAPASYQQPSYR